MELKQIEYFLQLAQMQNVSQTADYLRISQPTLSKSLSSLENDLGVPLFDRVGNRIRLNASGQRFYDMARQAMQQLNNAALSARQAVYEVNGYISILCIAFAPIITACVSEYMELNPLADMRLRQYNLGLDLSKNSFDFILTGSPNSLENLSRSYYKISEPILDDGTVLVIGPKHPLYARIQEMEEPIDLKLFSDYSFVTQDMDRNFTDYSYQICQSAGFFPKSYFHTDDFLVKMDIIREGLAISFLPESCVEEASRLCPGLRPVRFSPVDFRRGVYMIRKKKELLSDAALDFWDFFTDYYQLPNDEDE